MEVARTAIFLGCKEVNIFYLTLGGAIIKVSQFMFSTNIGNPGDCAGQ
jgi:hypothetical protein